MYIYTCNFACIKLFMTTADYSEVTNVFGA